MRSLLGLVSTAPLGAGLGLGLALFSVIAAAAGDEYSPQVPQVWLNAGFLSYHADRSKHFREDNYGFGGEVLLAPDHGLFAGSYINSDRGRSHYAMYQWRPLHWQPDGITVSAGLVAGGVDGYPGYHEGGWAFGALPMLFLEGERFGANFVVVPSVYANHWVAALQLKLRVW